MWTVVIDHATVVVFIFDYILRFWTADFKLPRRGRTAFLLYPFTPMALIDLLTILPSFGIVGRGARVLRIFGCSEHLKCSASSNLCGTPKH